MLIFLFAGPDFIPEYSDDFDKKFFTDSENPYIKTLELWRCKYSNKEMTHVV